MKFCHGAIFSLFILLSSDTASYAQTKNLLWPQKPAASMTRNNSNIDAQLAHQSLRRMLDAVNSSWFGAAYANVNAVDVKGSLKINLKAAHINNRMKPLNYSDQNNKLVKEDCTVEVKVNGTYFATADFRMELSGGLGNLIYYRVGNKGFLYSREQNAWTSRVELPPSNVPKTFIVWFRQCTDEIQKAYLDQITFKSSTGRKTDRTQTITFVSKTSAYDSNKREQTIDESLDFWKHGKVEITLDNTTHQPQQMHYSNESQGMDTDTIFHYNANGRPSNLAITNKSEGMRGPMSLNVNYDSTGLINHIMGKTVFDDGSIQFNLNLTFVKDRNLRSIMTVPPPNAIKKSREELEMLILVNASNKMQELQQLGLGMPRPKVINRQ